MTHDAHIYIMAHDDPDFLAVSLIEYAWVTSVYCKVADSTALHGILGHHVPVNSSKVSTWYHDVVPSRYVIGTLHFQNATLIEWFIKYQPTIEKSTYEAEFFVALCSCVECNIDPNVTCWYFNVLAHGIESLIDNSVQHADLYMKPTMSSFNLVDCEAIAASVLGFFHVPRKRPPVGIPFKGWRFQLLCQLLEALVLT